MKSLTSTCQTQVCAESIPQLFSKL